MILELRRLTENELELMMNWRMREDISRTLFSDVKLTLEGQKKWYEKIKDSKNEIRWVIWKDNKPIGSMYVDHIDYDNSRCESGWFLAEKEGMGFEAVISLQRNLNNYVFDTLGLNRMSGEIIDTNKPLVRIIEICGSKCEGVLRQHVRKNGVFHDVYLVGITKDMWYEKRDKMEIVPINIE